MATSEQIKALIKSHLKGDVEHFRTIALQVAATEARKGHAKLAEDIRILLGGFAKKQPREMQISSGTIPISRPRGELAQLLTAQESSVRLSQMVLLGELSSRLDRVLREQKSTARIKSHGLRVRRKLLLVGPAGAGKTMTAHAIAGELGLPLFTIRLDGLVSRFLGETIAKLRIIFDAIREFRGVYFFDEFDSIGVRRDEGTDVGEMRRVLNGFLQYIEEDQSSSLIVAATNHSHLLDYALYRRFDDVLEYPLPDEKAIQQVILNTLSSFQLEKGKIGQIAKEAKGLSQADIVTACEDAAKTMLLESRKTIRLQDLRAAINTRTSFRKK